MKKTFLHLADLPRDEKSSWVRAANRAGLKLSAWIRNRLNTAAARELGEEPKNRP